MPCTNSGTISKLLQNSCVLTDPAEMITMVDHGHHFFDSQPCFIMVNHQVPWKNHL